MMECDVVCRFCHRRILPHKSYTEILPNKSHADPDNQIYYEFNCAPCKSTQYFRSSGQPLHYDFYIGPYKLYFIPIDSDLGYQTPIFQLCNGNLGPIFELDYLPNLTPQNCTEERIKTLILFS